MPRILLIEDNELNRDMLTRCLERRGYCVIPLKQESVVNSVASEENPFYEPDGPLRRAPVSATDIQAAREAARPPVEL